MYLKFFKFRILSFEAQCEILLSVNINSHKCPRNPLKKRKKKSIFVDKNQKTKN